jgi:modification methylase
MFSFVGDTVLDPFMGTATTNYAAAKWGRNSIGIEVDGDYYQQARRRMESLYADLYFQIELEHRKSL